jgi:beta-lactamase class A
MELSEASKPQRGPAVWMLIAAGWCGPGSAAGVGEPLWAPGLRDRLQQVEKRSGGQLGVHVHHMGRDEHFSFRGEEAWYLASGVKVPVAITVLRDVERGALQLDTGVRLLPTDFVDGAGQTNSHPAGATLSVAFLLEQMIIHSDNTATDVLIRTVGLDRVNLVANELLGTTAFVMTPMVEVRRLAYGMFDPRAANLTSAQLLELREAEAGRARLLQLAKLLGVTPEQLLLPDMDSAFEAYYGGRLNSASLAEYSHLLARLADGSALGPWGTRHLLQLMSGIQTGARRISASLPRGSRFAHKTGTQHRRACDMGIVTTPVAARDERVIISACIRGVSQPQGDRALREAGAALVDAGVITLPSSGGTR